ncbi:hypothetical protein BJQ94_12865 [Cryobacterium sp. SO2]|uniref:hypothetical protein n=1 Tax=Cryobacterium sp. SO2 TaxID=1897060 RepID=UPI00223D6CE5|nr:hypothetical protein [Cryobacterium sp. SO2]WEO76251.1 hypothetical protein BJQ94_12865 [Cryobacterium sp. SO2]
MTAYEVGSVAPVLVALGILLHGIRVSEAAAPRLRALPADTAPSWDRAMSGQLRRGLIAGGILCGIIVALIVLTWMPIGFEWRMWRFLVPVLAGMLCLAALVLVPGSRPGHPAGAERALDLTPRTLRSFGPGWWFTGWLTATGLLVITVLCAGWLSSPDEAGNYTRITVAMGSASSSSDFLGWFYGVPLLAGIAGLTALTVIALAGIARSPLAPTTDARAVDVWLRRLGARTVLSVSTGAALVTLGQVWDLIGATARMTGSVTSAAGMIEVGTPFAALAWPLWALGYLAQGLGIALLLLPLFARRARFAPRAATTADESPSPLSTTSRA